MALTIQPLPDDAVNLIGAGEVIDSLAAVVRELAENAVDAGASRVTITLDLERWSVRVSDNGCGMSLEDLKKAAQPHTTSKIRVRQDLTAIECLGFRGEALHSLAQLSTLEIRSHQSSASEGWYVRYDADGTVLDYKSVAIAPGTVVSATHIFASWHQRRVAMPSPPQQLKQIQHVVQHLALCHPSLTWTLSQRDRDWFSIFPGQTPKIILSQVLRDVRSNDLKEYQGSFQFNDSTFANHLTDQPTFYPQAGEPDYKSTAGFLQSSKAVSEVVDTDGERGKLYVLIGLPDRCHRRRADWVKVAVNGRIVQFPEIEQAILGAFRRTLPRDRYPICFVHLTVPVKHVDWNRHPAKREIYLHHLKLWQEQVKSAITRLLTLDSSHVSDGYFSQRITQLIKTGEAGEQYKVHASKQEVSISSEFAESNIFSNESNTHNDNLLQTGTSRSTLIPLRAIAQVHNMYILAEHPEGMWLVEQHIAHERILYEQLCDRWHIIPLESPIILSNLSPNQIEQLKRLSVDIDEFGEELWAVRTVPAALAHRDDCSDALVELSLGGDIDTALVATACRTAIRNGTPLKLSEMQTLLDQWQSTQNPGTCPHGRPIYLVLEESRLSRFFRRHWVIGKSHGI